MIEISPSIEISEELAAIASSDIKWANRLDQAVRDHLIHRFSTPGPVHFKIGPILQGVLNGLWEQRKFAAETSK